MGHRPPRGTYSSGHIQQRSHRPGYSNSSFTASNDNRNVRHNNSDERHERRYTRYNRPHSESVYDS